MVSFLKWRKSSDRCQGNCLWQPITPFLATAAMIAKHAGRIVAPVRGLPLHYSRISTEPRQPRLLAWAASNGLSGRGLGVFERKARRAVSVSPGPRPGFRRVPNTTRHGYPMRNHFAALKGPFTIPYPHCRTRATDLIPHIPFIPFDFISSPPFLGPRPWPGFTSDRHRRWNGRMGIIPLQTKILIAKIEQRLYLRIQMHAR